MGGCVDRGRVVFWSRIALYAGVAASALSVVTAVQVYQGVVPAARGSVLALVEGAVGLMLVVPAGFALAMAR